MSAGRIARALILAVSMTISGCGSPGLSPTPSSTQFRSAMLTESPAATPLTVGAELRQVAVAELAISGFEGDPIRVTPGTLREGDLVWVLRADAADRASHLVAAADGMLDEASLAFGWVPVAIDGTPTLREPDLACPQRSTTVDELAALPPLGRLACFGDAAISFVGFVPVGCGAGGSPRTGTPEWLNGTWSGLGIGNEEPAPPNFEVDASVIARATPGLAIEPCGSPGWYRFAGHFDDPASATCRTETTTPDGSRPISVEPMLSELLCRAQLVITEAVRVPPPADA
jgi:hypothetical protein